MQSAGHKRPRPDEVVAEGVSPPMGAPAASAAVSVAAAPAAADGGDDVGGDAIGIQKAIKKFKDPAFSMKTLLGQASITTNDKGETVVVDRYNFNEENPDSFKDYARKAARVVSDPIYGSFREAGSIFGSDEGEGSFVRINLGKLL